MTRSMGSSGPSPPSCPHCRLPSRHSMRMFFPLSRSTWSLSSAVLVRMFGMTCAKISDTGKWGISRCYGQLPPARGGPREEGVHELAGYLVAHRRMGSSAVVENLDVVENRPPSIGPGLEAASVIHLVLQRRKEGFCHRVVVAVAGPRA